VDRFAIEDALGKAKSVEELAELLIGILGQMEKRVHSLELTRGRRNRDVVELKSSFEHVTKGLERVLKELRGGRFARSQTAATIAIERAYREGKKS